MKSHTINFKVAIDTISKKPGKKHLMKARTQEIYRIDSHVPISGHIIHFKVTIHRVNKMALNMIALDWFCPLCLMFHLFIYL